MLSVRDERRGEEGYEGNGGIQEGRNVWEGGEGGKRGEDLRRE